MALQNLADLKFNSALLRGILKRFYHEGDVCTVRMGPLRGKKLIYHPSVNFHAIMGLWDLDVFRFLQKVLVDGKLLGPQSTVADVGANIGFYSLWFSQRAREVHAFEPAPGTQKMLRENLAANGARNVNVVGAACGASEGTTDFFLAAHHHSSSLHASWAGSGSEPAEKITVPVTTLDSYFSAEGRAFPDFIKMDIEGGGTFALVGAAACFTTKRPYMLIESHTPDEDRAISNVLTGSDYSAYRFNTQKWVTVKSETHPNPEGVWGTMFLCPTEQQRNIAARI